MQSSSSEFSCSGFDNAHSSQVIKGKYVCAKGQSNPGTANSNPSATGSSGSKSAAGRFEINRPMVIGGSSVIAGLLALLF